MFGSIGFPEVLFILAVALLIFGPKRLPEVGRTLGKGLREFRKASNELRRSVEDEIRLEEPPAQPSVPPSVQPPLQPPVPAAVPTAAPPGTSARGDAASAESDAPGEEVADDEGESSSPDVAPIKPS